MTALLLVPLIFASTSTASSTTSTITTLGLEGLEELEDEAQARRGDRNATQRLEARSEQENIVDEIDVSAQRVAEASKPDTQLRVTGKQLIERGVTNLAQALDLISDTPIRVAGRGGFQSDIRGARKGGVLMLLDGVPIADPYLGNFDVTSIPATDIAEIRVSLTPASPLDGPSGNGGVVEIITRSASGPMNVRAGLQASDAPGAVAAVTGRAPVGGGLSIRVSGQATRDNRDIAFSESDNPAMGREDGKSGNAGLRAEQTFENGRLTTDLVVQRRSFLIPPNTAGDQIEIGSATGDLQYITREDMFRGIAGGETRSGHLLFSAHAYSLVIDRYIDHYHDPLRTAFFQEDHAFAQRTGGNAQADYVVSDDLRLTAVTHLLIEGGMERTTYADPAFPQAHDSGVAPIVEPAAGLSYVVTSWLGVDAAAGAGIPFAISGATPWPEGKVTATLTPTTAIQIRLTAARKGRLPSIKDRFDGLLGNRAVGPEIGTAAEASLLYKPTRWLSVGVTPFYRLVNGLIRLDPSTEKTGNVGDIRIFGGEARIETAPLRVLSLSASYQYANQGWVGNALSAMLMSRNPIDFFPAHRGEVGASFHPDPSYGIWSRARYVGERTDQGNTLGAYVTVDAAAWLRVESLRVTLRGENVLGQSYEIHAGVPGYGRTLFLGLEGVLE